MDTNGVVAPVGKAQASAAAPAPASSTPATKPTPEPSFERALKEALKARGFYTGKIDGDLGPESRAAIKAFKVKNGLPADGIPGPKVKELLGL
jgi:peptidoglycan hydrolase-like protein with peptidoglycan-binding domain